MNILIISDIHGIKTNILKVLDFYHKHKCQKLVVLGDILNNGFYTYDYDPEYIETILKSFGNDLICVRGNCDNYSDIKSIINDEPKFLEELDINNYKLYFTHGHVFNEYNWQKENSILVSGHTHIPSIKKVGTNLYINPGSISKPRLGKPSFLFFDGENFIIYDINDHIIDKKSMKIQK